MSDILRDQARIRGFTDPSQLLKAFTGIQLQNSKPGGNSVKATVAKKTNDEKDYRCYNCNSRGHFAKDCRKPKRVTGSCYGCGSNDHFIAQCSEKNTSEEQNNNYVRQVKINFDGNYNIYVIAECLIDSGSAISFIKKCRVPNGIFKQPVLNSYFGLNKSKLKTFGKISCFTLMNKMKIYFEVIVVANESMSHDVVLGRNFISACNFKIDLNALDGIAELNHDDIEQAPDNVEVQSIKNHEIVMGTEYEDSVKKQMLCESVELMQPLCPITTEEQTLRAETEDNSYERDMLNINIVEKHEIECNCGKEVSFQTKCQFMEIFKKHYIEVVKPKVPIIRSELKICIEKSKPFSCSPRRLSYAEKEYLQGMLDEYLKEGIIRPSDSEYASPIVLVNKKTSGFRLCIDFRKLNKVVIKDNYPLPLIDDLLDNLVNKTVFTKLDLKDGYFHVFMNEDSIKYTSFVTPLGQFEFLRMPMGLKNSAAVFQRFVNKIFADLIKENKVIVYMDDIMIASSNMEEHLKVLKEVFERLVHNKLKLRLDKCEFLQSQVKYLGFNVTSKGIRADDKGIEAVQNFPTPEKIQTVQSLVGLCLYFRRFIKDFSIIAKPLYDLLRKDKKFIFGEKELDCFLILKEKLLHSPVLAICDYKHETELHCDASSVGFGAVLMQKKDDGKSHPIFFFSKRTTETESKYHSFELETLAIIYALRRFRIYLQGRQFKIVTDCNSLTLTLNKVELNPRIARWALEMQNYDYELIHRSGDKMQHVDALSRCMNVMIVETNSFEENLIICQSRDPKIQKIKSILEKTEDKMYEMRNGGVFRKSGCDRLLFCVPDEKKSQVLHKYHNELGHIGRDKMIDVISKSYWFRKIKDKCSAHIENCLKCVAFSPKIGKAEGFLHSIPKGDKPFELIHIDHYGPVAAGRANKHIFVIVDGFTKFVRLYTTKSTNTKEVIKALKDYFRSYSRPKCIVSDRGSSFTSNEFEQFLKDLNIKHLKIATGSPQANGQVERLNRSIGPMIAKLIDPDKGLHWDSVVEKVEFSFNNTLHRSIKQLPSKMLFGIEQKGEVIDQLREKLEEVQGSKEPESLKVIREEAAENQKKAQSYNETYYNKTKRRPNQYQEGDFVMVKNFDSTVGISRKRIPKHKGPYVVEKVLNNDRFLLKDIEGFQVSRNPYQGVWSAQNMRPWIGKRGYS